MVTHNKLLKESRKYTSFMTFSYLTILPMREVLAIKVPLFSFGGEGGPKAQSEMTMTADDDHAMMMIMITMVELVPR